MAISFFGGISSSPPGQDEQESGGVGNTENAEEGEKEKGGKTVGATWSSDLVGKEGKVGLVSSGGDAREVDRDTGTRSEVTVQTIGRGTDSDPSEGFRLS